MRPEFPLTKEKWGHWEFHPRGFEDHEALNPDKQVSSTNALRPRSSQLSPRRTTSAEECSAQQT